MRRIGCGVRALHRRTQNNFQKLLPQRILAIVVSLFSSPLILREGPIRPVVFLGTTPLLF
ncbi:MAG: hypothetical protein A2667_01825 [Candidatus Wildermuthbacteria bacterium RIFCSPHIGHO2_01_FULL_47_27]|uniref:Uncharacterized protein n=2 Tax=Candidatus Wildermuthiibacteriota TaxID=1817923 RepID=A0A1G2RT26_9BACT|nr:MAG: hypothetical protein A2667_01825 [Candidatus Wildermuthbacteria bacterium RIFCSPHIGHO2_01_FULL_47_27]OHA68926.1 MAG: hypothetical protein A3D59_00515 [Candidatus Wildermuthbacteria bacterium RIFCSPHIGHO2_02_FULL_47_17]OHA75529.1 MAG: hypothetical protein A3A32_00575 [Candidatus Wildermuthbacteria bacterium RIFCSPLOWO2_01_FULL_48_35]